MGYESVREAIKLPCSQIFLINFSVFIYKQNFIQWISFRLLMLILEFDFDAKRIHL